MNTLILQAAMAGLLLVGQTEGKLFVAAPLTMPNEFTTGIEGPACDREGNILAVNVAKQGTIGRVTPTGKGEVFLELSGDSVGNGIRFDREGFMYIADYVNHNVLRVDPKTKALATFAHHDGMNQPNDLAIGPDGTLPTLSVAVNCRVTESRKPLGERCVAARVGSSP